MKETKHNIEPIENLLKVENLEKNEYVVTSAIIEPPIEKVLKKPKKLSLSEALLSAIAIRKNDESYSTVRPVKAVGTSILFLILIILLYFFYQVSNSKLISFVLLLIFSIALPLLSTIMQYELCSKKTIGIFQISISFTFGLLLYIAIQAIVQRFFLNTVYESTVNTVIVPIFLGLAQLLLSVAFVRIYNISDESTGLLIAVAIGMGYATGYAANGMLDILFIPIEATLDNVENLYIGNAILDSRAFIEQSLFNSLNEILLKCLYYPICISSWSVVIGSVATNRLNSSKSKEEKSVSIYLLLVLVIAIHMLSNFTTSFNYFNLIVKLVLILASVIISSRLINNILNKELSPSNK